MRFPALEPGERIRADLTSPARSMAFPLIETVAWTGLLWIGIGFIDGPQGLMAGSESSLVIRTFLVLVWAAIVVGRFLIPLIRARRRRFILTDRRVIARAAALKKKVDSIPLVRIHSARRRKGGIAIAVYGDDRPLYFESVPKARRLEDMINHSVVVR